MRVRFLPLLFGVVAGAGITFEGLNALSTMRGGQLMPDFSDMRTAGNRIRALDEFVRESPGKDAVPPAPVAADVFHGRGPSDGPSQGSMGIRPAAAGRQPVRWPDVDPVNVTLGELPLRYRVTPPRLVVVGLTRPLYRHNEVSVILDRIPVPVILVMMSGEPVNWRLRNPGGNTLVKVIHGPGTRVLMEPGSTVPIEQQPLGPINSFMDGDPGCRCLPGFFYCPSMPVLPLLNELQVKTGARVYGFAFARDTTAMMVPTTLMDPALPGMMSEFRQYRAAKDACFTALGA